METAVVYIVLALLAFAFGCFVGNLYADGKYGLKLESLTEDNVLLKEQLAELRRETALAMITFHVKHPEDMAVMTYAEMLSGIAGLDFELQKKEAERRRL